MKGLVTCWPPGVKLMTTPPTVPRPVLWTNDPWGSRLTMMRAAYACLNLKTNMRLTVAGLRDQVTALRRGAPYYIPAVGPPGSLGVMTTDDSLSGWTTMAEQSVDVQWDNRVAARIALRVGMYRPGLKAAKLPCPALFCITDKDSLAPAERTAKLAARGPRNEIKRYPIGHFDIYVGEDWERAVADQTEFLVRTLKP